ncbi:MAG: hypothetical protein ABIC40_04390 [bacterium]
MNKVIPVIFGIFALVLTGILGCNGNPTAPMVTLSPDSTTDLSASGADSHRNLGYYSLKINTGEMSAEIIPLRSSKWHLNLTGVLNGTLGVSVGVPPGESDPIHGLFVLDITLTHPFGDAPQFAGFDVKGILIAPGSLNVGPYVFSDIGETQLENADGYTRWWNPTEFTKSGFFGYTKGKLTKTPASTLTATVNPYKYFADVLGANDSVNLVQAEPLDGDNGRGVFKAGSANTRRYRIRFPLDPTPVIEFGYAIDASWATPLPNPPDEVPDDFPMEANQPEACDIGTGTLVNTLFFDSESGLSGGVLRIVIDVYDWQGRVAGNIQDQIEKVILYSPDLFTGSEDAIFFNETPVKAQYIADLTGVAVPMNSGEVLLAVQVVSKGGLSYKQTGNPAPDVQIAAWTVMTLDIIDPECTADSNNDFAEAEPVGVDQLIVGQLCGPTDSADYFTFEIPPGFDPQGKVTLFCDAEMTGVMILDGDENYIYWEPAVDGVAVLDIDSLNLMPGSYYLNVSTTLPDKAFLYLLEMSIDLIDIMPISPVNVTPDNLFLDAAWIEKHDNFVFFTGPYGMWVYDVTDPNNPVFVSRIEKTIGAYPGFHWPYAYVWEHMADNPAGIDLIDFTDPYNPVFYDNVLTIPYEVKFITMNSENMYVAVGDASNSYVKIYDYSTDPHNPVELNQFDVLPQLRLALFDPEGPDTSLVALSTTYLKIYSVEDPMSVTEEFSNVVMGGEYHAVAVDGSYILETHDAGPGTGYLGLFYYEPGIGVTVGGITYLPGTGDAISSMQPYAYVADGSDGLTVVNYTNLSVPYWVFNLPSVANSKYTYADSVDNLLFQVPQQAGFEIFDLSDPVNPVEITRLKVVDNPYSVAKSGDYLHIAERGFSHWAYKIVNVSNPSNAYVEGEEILSIKPNYIASNGVVTALSEYGGGNQIYMFDASDPSAPSDIYIQSLSSTITSVAISDTTAYVALNNHNLAVYDVSSPPGIVPHLDIPTPATIVNLVINGNYMFGNSGSMTYSWSLADPFVPLLIMTTGYGYNVYDIDVKGKYEYVMTTDTIDISDISDPSSPVWQGDAIMPYAPGMRMITVDGQFAYMKSAPSDPAISVNVWPPDSPAYFADVDPSGSYFAFTDMLADDGYLYELLAGRGIRIYDLY